MTNDEIIKLILNKGEVQISDKERNLSFSNIKHDIANLIVEKTYNINTGFPFPQTLILQVLNDIHFDAKEEQSSKKQAIQAIKIIQDQGIIPIERKYMQIDITMKKGKVTEDTFPSVIEKVSKFLEDNKAKIVNENKDRIDTFKIVFNVLPNVYRDIVTLFEECLVIEVLSSKILVVEKHVGQSKYEEEFYKTIKKDDTHDQFKNMKISNSRIDDFLEENEEDVNTNDGKPKKIDKKVTCTKCKGSSFTSNDDLRKHFKCEWHIENARRCTEVTILIILILIF